MRFARAVVRPANKFDPNEVLPVGFFGIEEGTGAFKVANGISKWSDLPYADRDSSDDGTGSGNLVDDTSPQLGGDLHPNGHTVGDATAADLTKLHGAGTLSGNNTGDQDLSGKQPLDSDLTAIAALTSAADKVPYATGAGTWALADLTAAGRALAAAADVAAQRTILGFVPVINATIAPYNASPSNTAAQNETAINAAIAALKAQGGGQLYLGSGTFQKTTGLDLRASSTFSGFMEVYGVNSGVTFITVTTDTAELLQVGGYANHLHDFCIQHANETPTSSTADGLVFYKSSYSSFKRLNIRNAGKLMSIAQVDLNDPGTSSGSGNNMFSNTFEDINLHNYYESGIYLHSYPTAGSTGSSWTNVYLQNGSPGSPRTSTGNPIDLQGIDENVFNQLNIEDNAGVGAGILCNNANVVINSMHFERVNLTGFRPQYVRAYGTSQIDINGMSIGYGDFSAGTPVYDYTMMFNVAAGGVINATNIWIFECTKTGATSWYWVQADDTTATNSVTIDTPIVKVGSPAFTAPTTSPAANGIKRLGSTHYSPTLITPALGTPASGTLTNCTLPVSGITASTTTALGVGSIELGAATDTTLSRSAAGVLAVESKVVAFLDATMNNQTGTTYTLVLADDGKVVTLNNAAAITVTVPQDSAVAIPIGSYIEFVQLGAGQVTFAAGTGVTLNARGAALKINAQYGVAGLRKVAANTFVLAGDTA